MIEKMIFEYHEMPVALFVMITLMTVFAAFLVKVLTDRLMIAAAALPILWFSGVVGHLFLLEARIQLGMDQISDGVVAAAFGMAAAVLVLVGFKSSMRLLRNN